MSYQVMARKWRPQDFAQLVGQNHVSQTLLNALRHDRLHHALLFTGPRGTGKTSSARILAKSLRCPNAVEFVPCHECTECNDIAAGRSLDVIEIDGASNNGVDAIRELRDTVGYMPSSGQHKLYIIDEVHMLSTSAFNALLKTLEEPPQHVVFIMATTEVHKIPNTILSRCQRYDFRRIPTAQVSEHLKSICVSENVKASDEALWTIARQGEGAMRDSLSLLDQVITFCEGNIGLEKVIEALGLTDRQLLIDVLEAFVEHDSAKSLKVVERVFKSGFDTKVFAQDLLEEIRHMQIVKLCGDHSSSIVDLPESEIQRLKSLSDKLSSEDIHLLFDMALKGIHDIIRSPEPRIVLEMVILRMTQAPRVEDILNLPASAPATAKSNRPQMSGNTTEKKTSEPTKPAMKMAPGADKWMQLVEKIKGVNGVVGAKLENSFLARESGKNLVVGVPPKMKFLYDQISTPEFKQKLLNYIGTFWGPGYSLEVEYGGEEKAMAATPKAVAQKLKDEEESEIRRQVEEHPLVKSAQSVFKSRIKSIKEST